MSLTLQQIVDQKARIDLRGITPDRLASLDVSTIKQLTITADHVEASLSSYFSVEGTPGDQLSIMLSNNRIDGIGSGMKSGTLTVTGDTGHYTGAEMSGGKLIVTGNCGDFTGSALKEGELIIQGNVGNATGAPMAGGLRGQSGGVIQVQGHAGDRTGECQRRGLLIIEGDTGELTGYRMIAGTLYVGGCSGKHTGLNMRRGTILLEQRAAQLPVTLNYNGASPLTAISLITQQLKPYLNRHTPRIKPGDHLHRYVGDLAVQGQGEIILLS